MKTKWFVLLAVAALVVALLVAMLPMTMGARAVDGASHMPPEPGLIMKALRDRGVIPADASEEEALAIYHDYIGRKLAQPEDKPHPLGAASLAHGEGSGNPINHHGRIMRPNNVHFDNVLTLLVEFTDPAHNLMPQPASGDNTTFWVADFNREHYQNMLFDRNPKAWSMSNYYLEQSGGRYTLDGVVYGWVQVDNPESEYGADSLTGTDNLNGPVWRVVRDTVQAAGDTVPWAEFDTEDPYDIDGDGVYSEPDGYVDHIQLVHAGAGQEAGGGAQGDDAIWSHSWWVAFGAGDCTSAPYGGVQTSDPNVCVGPYTINPEDGTIGVFTHEFGHDLGLPDLYDTIYSGEASTGFWTLMASGSWLACPGEALGTCPSNMGIWEKYVLGWADPIMVYPGELAQNIQLRAAESRGPAEKAIRINLPQYSYLFEVNEPHSGDHEWYSDHGDLLNNTLTQEFDLPVGAALTFWTWYDIELDWDYGYVEVSTDSGASWDTVEGTITTNTDPNGNNPEGNGITGNSGGWVSATFDLSAYGDQTVLLRFRYETDAYVQGLGWTIDDITINGFFDDVESGAGDWVADGWYIFEGTAEIETFHYYMVEWREPIGFDVSMTNWYNFLYGNTVENFSASPGMLLWYRNGRYNENWVGVHPWAGAWLIVDAHPDLVLADDLEWLANAVFDPDPNMGLPFRTRIQLADATFGLESTPQQAINSWWGWYTDSYLPALAGVSTFDDSQTYVDYSWAPWLGIYYEINASISSVDTPEYGLIIEVTKHKPTGGRITVDFTGFTP